MVRDHPRSQVNNPATEQQGFLFMERYYVYILQSSKGRHYIGYTSNLPQRIAQHNRKHKGFTGATESWILDCALEFRNKSEAMRIEKYLKSLKDYRLAEEYIKTHTVVEHSG